MATIKKVYNVGVYEKGIHRSRIKGKHTAAYDTWVAMLQRCYDKKLHERNPSYSSCVVAEEWHNFQVFASWFNKHYIEGYQLDKDLLIPGNKIYSPDTCSFIPQEVNLALLKPHNKRKLPLGVYARYNKFVVHIKNNKVSKYIGTFNTPEEAAKQYEFFKKSQLQLLAEKYKNNISVNAYAALLNYSLYNTN